MIRFVIGGDRQDWGMRRDHTTTAQQGSGFSAFDVHLDIGRRVVRKQQIQRETINCITAQLTNLAAVVPVALKLTVPCLAPTAKRCRRIFSPISLGNRAMLDCSFFEIVLIRFDGDDEAEVLPPVSDERLDRVSVERPTVNEDFRRQELHQFLGRRHTRSGPRAFPPCQGADAMQVREEHDP